MNDKKSLQEEISSFFFRNNMPCEVLSMKEKWRIQQAWREKFAKEVKSSTGKWIFRGFDWHAFSYEFTPCLRGARAEEVFNQKSADKCFLVTSHRDIPAYLCNKGEGLNAGIFIELLSSLPGLIDFYIFPIDYKWTMVFVHEPNMGPFFAE